MATNGILRVRNWNDLQHYKDRSPPWIKLYNRLLSDYEFSCLQDASKAHLLGIWLLASQLDNRLPNDPKWIASRINATSKIDLKSLIDSGFLELEQDDSVMLAESTQDACLETEERREEKNSMSSKSSTPIEDIFEHWKTVHEHPKAVLTSKRRKLIRNALKDYSGEDLCKAISGYLASPHHMGKNNNGTIYDSIELLLRDAKHIESGLGFDADPPDGKSRDERYAETAELAKMLGISRSLDEDWDDFNERVRVANERRIAGLTGTASKQSSSHTSNGHAEQTREG